MIDDPINFKAIRRQARGAAKSFLKNRFDSYLAMVERVEALPANQTGTDKTWIEEASEAYRVHYRHAVRVK